MENVKMLFLVWNENHWFQIGHFYFYELLDRILKYFNIFLLVLNKNEQFDSQR